MRRVSTFVLQSPLLNWTQQIIRILDVHLQIAASSDSDILSLRSFAPFAPLRLDLLDQMKTNLAASIKSTPEGQEADSILRTCVHCGFCTATCPTYQLLGDELDSPRGRIYLMKEVLEGNAVTAKTQMHLDRCLTCRACETTCPSGVQYGRLVDIGRNIVDQHVSRPVSQSIVRSALRFVLPRPAVFKPLLKVGQAMRPLLPAALKKKIPKAGASRIEWPTQYHARKMLVLDGCVQPALAPDINPATARVLDRLGISLVRAEAAGCCGAVTFHLNRQAEALDYMRRNIDAWWPHVQAGVEAVVITASGCGTMVREYGHLLARDPQYAEKAARISELSKDISEVIFAERTSSRTYWDHPSTPCERGKAARSLPLPLLVAARPSDSRHGGSSPDLGRLRTDHGSGFALVLRIGGHVFDSSTGVVATAVEEQGRRAGIGQACDAGHGEHRLPDTHPERDVTEGQALDQYPGRKAVMTKTAMITGATAGFGAAAVRRFANAGWRVVATGRRADRLQKLIDEFGKEKVFTASFDMRKPDAIEAALAALPDSFRNIDLLINNAGLALGTAPAQKASLEQWNQMIETNVTGLVTITHRLLPTLIAQKGAIINISSVAATYPYPGGNVYGGTKAFVTQFSLGLALGPARNGRARDLASNRA